MKVVSFSSIKGGVGKTTSCCNLAFYFASKGKKVAVIDFDSQGGATHHLSSKFQKSFKASIYDILIGKVKTNSALHKYCENLYLIPTSLNFADISYKDFSGELKQLVESLNDFDFLFFDLSPAIYPGSTIPLGVSDYVVVPVDCAGGLSVLGLKAEQKLIKSVKNLKLIGIIPTMCDRTSMTKCVLDYLNTEFKAESLPLVRRNTHLAQSGSLGKTIFEYKKSSNGAKDYALAGQELIRRISQ